MNKIKFTFFYFIICSISFSQEKYNYGKYIHEQNFSEDYYSTTLKFAAKKFKIKTYKEIIYKYDSLDRYVDSNQLFEYTFYENGNLKEMRYDYLGDYFRTKEYTYLENDSVSITHKSNYNYQYSTLDGVYVLIEETYIEKYKSDSLYNLLEEIQVNFDLNRSYHKSIKFNFNYNTDYLINEILVDMNIQYGKQKGKVKNRHVFIYENFE